MSQSYDPGNPERASGPGAHVEQSYRSEQSYASGHGYGQQGYLGGPGFAGGGGYPGETWYAAPPPPPRGRRRRGLAIAGAAALVAGAAAGALIGSLHPSATATATATSKTALSASQIASRVDAALADVVSTDGYQGATSMGTGIVLSSNGEVLTNNHVINGATSVKVTDIGNGKTYPATVVGYDASHDVAVLQLQDASGLTTASLGDSATVQTGDAVTALGNAGGKGGTPSVATGTVTALNQSITASEELTGASEQLAGLIEDNANIQLGDSGGPLVNAYGQVIGMDTAASAGYQFQSQSGQNAEQAYAIPIDEALSIAKQVEVGVTSADVHIGATAFLGVETQGSSSGNGSGSGLGGQGGFGGFGGQDGFGGQGGTAGVSVAGVVSGSPAAGAGLTAGDTITAVDGQSVSSPEDIAHALVTYHPGNSISISWVDAYGQSQTTTVTLATGPAA